jgi:hypothetical protein
MKNCERAKYVDYGLQILPKTVLHLANDEEFRWLLQPELKAINDALKYGIKLGSRSAWTYRGYLNAEGLP